MGLLTFASSPVGQGVVSSQPKIESLNGFSVKLRLNRLIFESIAADTQHRIFRLDKSRLGDTDTQDIFIMRSTGDAYALRFISAVGTVTSNFVTLSAIPSSLVIYAHAFNAFGPDAFHIYGYNPDNGDLVLEGASGNYLVDFEVGAGTGEIVLHNSPVGCVYDGLAIYNTQLSGVNRYSTPTTGDAGIVSLFTFDSGGSTTPDDISGNAMTITNGSFSSGGSWGGGGGGGGSPDAGALQLYRKNQLLMEP